MVTYSGCRVGVAGFTSFNQDVRRREYLLKDVLAFTSVQPSFSKMTITFGRLQNSSSQVTIPIRDQF